MSDYKRLSLSDIDIRKPLSWDVMDSFGHLLLSKGYVIDNLATARELIERGMYIEVAAGHYETSFQFIFEPEPPSVLRSINMAVTRLAALFRDINKFPDARKEILDIVKLVRFAIHLNEDVALACIQLNQESGNYAVRHCVDTAILAITVAQTMHNKSDQEIQDIAAAALTMNISMWDIQEKLQEKKEALSDAELSTIRNYPISSIRILHDAGIEDAEWLEYVLLHHEHEDGTGYPIGKVKGKFPYNAKILMLADGFCARIASRGDRGPALPSVALRDIFIENGAYVDATLGAYFIKVLGLYPPGTFVKLKNSEVAIITQRGSDNGTCTAHSLVNANGELYSAPLKRDTSTDPFTITKAIHPSEASVHVNLQQIWGSLANL